MSTSLEQDYLTQILDSDDATCEVRWDGGEVCGKPVSWHIMGHHVTEHVYYPARICQFCMAKALNLGFANPMFVCVDCEVGPLMRDIRPI